MKRFAIHALVFMSLLGLMLIMLDVALNAYARNEISHPEFETRMRKLVVQNPVSPEIIITGDSRAGVHIDPEVITKMTGRETVSVSVGALDLVTLYTGLKKYDLLNKKRMFVISASIFQVNDGAISTGFVSPSIIAHMTFWERIRTFIRDPLVWFYNDKQILGYFLKSLVLKNAGRTNSADYPRRGFVTLDHVMSLPLGETVAPVGGSERGYESPDIQGARWRIFKSALAGLISSDDTFIIYQPPISPAWRALTTGTFIDDLEKEYGRQLARELEGHANVLFIDLYSTSNPALTDTMYADKWHLNKDGAQIFTKQVLPFVREVLRKGRSL